MKTSHKVLRVCTLLTLLAVSLIFSCKKPKEPERKVKLENTVATAQHSTAPADTIAISEAETFFQKIVTSGGLVPFDTAYGTIFPDYTNALLYSNLDPYPGIPGQVALYVPIAQNWQTGKRLLMILMKEQEFVRGLLAEDIPNWAFLSGSSSNYAYISGIKRFFKSNGTLISAFSMANGVPTGEINPGGGALIAANL